MGAIDRFTAPTGVRRYFGIRRCGERRLNFVFRQRLVQRTFILSTSLPPQTDTKV
jgi:hypothetical protein